jgi:hypothetical protein
MIISLLYLSEYTLRIRHYDYVGLDLKNILTMVIRMIGMVKIALFPVQNSDN